jgi:hypothetical protein
MDPTSLPSNGWLAIACGASFWVTRTAPTPIGVVVTVALCALMLFDAATTPD